jgi:hypothetical protein
VEQVTNGPSKHQLIKMARWNVGRATSTLRELALRADGTGAQQGFLAVHSCFWSAPWN